MSEGDHCGDAVAPQLLDGRERVEGLEMEAKVDNKEMDILKNLPSFNSENFSKFLSQGGNGCYGRHNSVSTHYSELHFNFACPL